MQKTLKRLFVLLLSAAIIACVAVVAACDNGETVAEGKMVIYVYKPDGTLLNGKTDGKNGGEVTVQFCIVGNEGACNIPKSLGEDGRIELDIEEDILRGLRNAGANDSSEFEVHILNTADYQSDGDYGTFTKDTLHNNGKPYNITLKAA